MHRATRRHCSQEIACQTPHRMTGGCQFCNACRGYFEDSWPSAYCKCPFKFRYCGADQLEAHPLDATCCGAAAVVPQSATGRFKFKYCVLLELGINCNSSAQGRCRPVPAAAASTRNLIIMFRSYGVALYSGKQRASSDQDKSPLSCQKSNANAYAPIF